MLGYVRSLMWLMALLMMDPAKGEACTGIELAAKDGSFVHGRTLEFGTDLEASLVFIPRGFAFTGMTTQGAGMAYQSKYASLGAICFGKIAIMDGINEKGLCVGAFYFPGFAEYTPTTLENQSKSLSPIDFSNWILIQFGTIEEVKAALSQVFISPTIYKEWGPQPPPLHYIVFDRSGRSVVSEPIQGKLVYDDNPLGVLTNSPSFEWQMTHLRNYINLSPLGPKPLRLEGRELSSYGQGGGLVGLPGDFTPSSRFVRAAIFTLASIPSPHADAAIWQLFHILNQFDIPYGAVRSKEKESEYIDYTMMTCARDPQALKFYIKTYQDQTVKVVELKKFDFNSNSILHLPIEGTQRAKDISADFNP